ncbi:unnamed protein product [Clonostachys solani]|uniref:Heterokaryon incompatibility domain-containing protein n=1 Tax=Clonostachys solani TaxID=160281 RepID=A0A9N9Z1R9_9HYPO|nr:unnamed protein product [Clonostachys solani]
MASSSRNNCRWRKRKRRGSFQFRRWEPGGSVPFGDDEIPKFNLDSVTRALSQGWDPNTTWTEDELVFPPPDSGCEMPILRDPWCHFNTPIHRALWLGQLDVAECLLTHGADINQLNALGRTVLHEALDIGLNTFNDHWTETATWIVEHGADLNKETETRTVLVTKQDPDGDEYKSSQLGGVSPLMMAMQLGNIEKVQRLVDAGVDVNLSIDDEARWRPLDLALMSRQLHMMEILEQAGASLSVNMTEKVNTEAINIEELSQVQLQAKADDLLCFCLTRSHKGLPERECNSIYQYVLQTIEFRSAWASRDRMDALGKYKSPNDAFFKVLSSLARTRNPYAVPDSYCTLCTQMIAHYSGNNKAAGVPFQYAATIKTLEETAAANGCPLCGMLLDALELNLDGKRKKPKPTDMPDAPVELKILAASFGDAELQVKCGERSSGLALKYLNDDLLHDLLDHPDDLELGTGSLRALALGRTWINNCKRGHPKCRRPQDLSPPILPTRVLDIAAGTAMGPTARLVETCGNMRGAYCALSYCWGTSQGVTTTKCNLESHKVDIPVESLAATIQDAIVAALGLGFRYLWADGLCIVQDDPLDWDSEAGKMSLVYANATITISTIIGTDCGEGLFKRRVLRQPTPLPFPLANVARPDGDARRPLLAVHPPADYTGQYKHHPGFKFRGPIHSRGWTCQEQVLSTRILWYGPGHLQWECMSLYAADQSPSGITYQGNYPGDSPVTVTRTKEYVHRSIWPNMTIEEEQPFSSFGLAKSSLLDEWENIVADYSKRSLSVSSDRIPAILGLAKSVAPSIKCEFVAGVWKGEHFLRSLLWRVDKPSSSPITTAHYPSWTWASVDGTTIEYDLLKDTAGHEVTWPASLISLDVSLKGKAQSGATGSVTIRGPLGKMNPTEIDLMDPSNPRFGWGMLEHPSYYPDTAGGASWYLDIMKMGQGPRMSGYGYPLWPNGRPGSTVRLFLEPLDDFDPPRTFRRIGIGRFGWDANDVVVREVDII